MTRFLLFTLLFPLSNLLIASSVLVSTEWLEKNINKENIVLIDMSEGLQYQRFHLPGAIQLPYDALNQQKNKVSLSVGSKTIKLILNQLGITPQQHIIIYDDMGGLHAGRFYWELKQLGHEHVSILNGGLVKWIREGRKISTDTPVLRKSNYKASTNQINTATLDDVNKASNSKNKIILLDVRSEEEYIGNRRQTRSGHIPGARWLAWDQALDIEAGFTLKDDPILLGELSKIGIKDKNQQIIVYCRSGHRASHTYYTLKHLGFNQVKLYDASMKEYERIPNLPLTKGKKP